MLAINTSCAPGAFVRADTWVANLIRASLGGNRVTWHINRGSSLPHVFYVDSCLFYESCLRQLIYL